MYSVGGIFIEMAMLSNHAKPEKSPTSHPPLGF